MARSIFFLIALLVGAVFSVTTTIAATAAYAQEGGMVKTTDKGTLDIRLAPAWSDAGQATFTVSFLNPGTDTVHQHQDYDFRLLKDDGKLTVPYTFQENGDYAVQVFLAGTGIPAIPTDEEATCPITVAPELPTGGGILAIVLAGSLTTAIVLSQRMKLI